VRKLGRGKTCCIFIHNPFSLFLFICLFVCSSLGPEVTVLHQGAKTYEKPVGECLLLFAGKGPLLIGPAAFWGWVAIWWGQSPMAPDLVWGPRPVLALCASVSRPPLRMGPTWARVTLHVGLPIWKECTRSLSAKEKPVELDMGLEMSALSISICVYIYTCTVVYIR
jgi:hypothetical protein